ncbi:MAG: hypothetical protein MI748_01435, partial [Opitutales bacterium]|nr:hypothetical protein [Opitutales bacterium]
MSKIYTSQVYLQVSITLLPTWSWLMERRNGSEFNQASCCKRIHMRGFSKSFGDNFSKLFVFGGVPIYMD